MASVFQLSASSSSSVRDATVSSYALCIICTHPLSVNQLVIFCISGWARKIITNGDTNKPAYLERFFNKAFQADANGNATNNKAGQVGQAGIQS